MAVKSGQ